MRILIDINHPAHVHYFRNFIKLMEAKGHEFCVINRDSIIINQLLDYYGIEHIIRGGRQKKKGGIVKTLYGLVKTVALNVRVSRQFKVDVYVGFASAPCALASFVLRKPCMLLDDTDHNVRNQLIYFPFTTRVILPFYFHNGISDCFRYKTCRLDAYIEQLYLHSSVYRPVGTILNKLGLDEKNYVIIRFSAFDAGHDAGVSHLSSEFRKEIVRKVAEKFRVVLSLEAPSNDPFLSQYVVKFPPQEMHDLLAYARFLITEGATMASEAFALGVPYLYVNPLRCGYIEYQCNHYSERACRSTDETTIVNCIDKLAMTEVNRELERSALEKATSNPTALLVEYVDSWPKYKGVSNLSEVKILE